MTQNSAFTALLALLAGLMLAVSPAAAKCKKMGFTVNDYGKDGPTNDAKELLDKHIAEWAANQGISKFTIGKKSVNCELFLDVLLFDEHTCTASATVCWDEPGAPAPQKTAEPKAAKDKTEAAKADAPASAVKAESGAKDSPVKTVAPVEAAPGAIETPAAAPATEQAATPPEATPSATPAAEIAPSQDAAKEPAASASSAAADPAPSAVETGAIPAQQEAPQAKKDEGPPVPLTDAAAPQKAATPDPATAPVDVNATASRAAEAAAAAERAAEAAERAAAAAERAATAAAERAAKAAAGAAASNTTTSAPDGAVVPPVKAQP